MFVQNLLIIERQNSMTLKFSTQQDITSNLNSQFGLTADLQRLLASQNTQFVINLCRELKINSYSVPSLAMHIATVFFHKKCYLNFDRFVLLAACLLLASKLKSMDVRFKNLCNSFYNVIGSKSHNPQPYNEEKMKKLKEYISIYETEVLRTLQFDIDTITPHDYICGQCEFLYPDEKQLSRRIYNTTKIIVLDSYRSMCCLMFHPVVVFVCCFLIANRYEGKYPHLSKVIRSSLRDENINDQKLYEYWLKVLGNKQNIQISAADVRDCMKLVNKVLTY